MCDGKEVAQARRRRRSGWPLWPSIPFDVLRRAAARLLLPRATGAHIFLLPRQTPGTRCAAPALSSTAGYLSVASYLPSTHSLRWNLRRWRATTHSVALVLRTWRTAGAPTLTGADSVQPFAGLCVAQQASEGSMTDALHYAPSPQQPVCPAGDAYSNPLVFAPDLLCGPGGLPAHAALLLPKPVFGATAIVLAVGTMAARLLPRLWASKGRKGKALEDFTVLASPIALDDLLEERPSARGARERPEGSSRSAGKPLTSGAGGCTRGDAQGQVGLEDHVTADQPFPVQEDHVADLFARLSLDPDHEHSEWEPFSSKRSKTLSQKVWKKRRSAHLELRCLTVYEGLSVEEVTGFYLDREHQIAQYGDSSSLEVCILQWSRARHSSLLTSCTALDQSVPVAMQVLEEHASGEYYRCHCSYPWPLASREYVYGRRAFLNMGIDGSQAVFISKGCEHPQMQMGKKASKKGASKEFGPLRPCSTEAVWLCV
eukprot:scaffold3311_cov411-Prasinococcus_capsulatus_cf.AAC.19